MNEQRLKQLKANAEAVRTGGKGTSRRKKKIIHKTPISDDKKLQNYLKKLSVTNIPGIEEVNMIKEDGTVIHFNNPKVQASVPANTFSVTGSAETKQLTEMLPGILNQLGAESLTHLKKLANNVTNQYKSGEEEIPDLVGDFEEASKVDDKADPASTEGHAETSTIEEKSENSIDDKCDDSSAEGNADAFTHAHGADAAIFANKNSAAKEHAEMSTIQNAEAATVQQEIKEAEEEVKITVD